MSGPDEKDEQMDDFKQMNEFEQMDEFEQGLARALKRVDARAEMTVKFLAIADDVHQQHKQTGRWWITPKTGGKVLVMPRPQVWIGGALAAMLVLGVFVGDRVHQRREQERVQQQFDAAMRVTDHALDQTRAQLERAGLTLGE